MASRSGGLRSHCPINFGLEIFGDRWTLLILRDLLMQGKSTFREFQGAEERIASNILADRLQRLAREEIITARKSDADGRQTLYEPTKKGRALLPVLVEMAYWGARHDPKTAAPPEFVAGYETDREGLIAAITAGQDPSRR